MSYFLSRSTKVSTSPKLQLHKSALDLKIWINPTIWTACEGPSPRLRKEWFYKRAITVLDMRLVVLAVLSAACVHDVVSETVIVVTPGTLHECSEAAAAATSEPLRCVLEPGVYSSEEDLGHIGSISTARRVSIAGRMGGGAVVMSGLQAVDDAHAQWTLHGNSSTIWKTTLPAALRVKRIRQAFADGTYIPEARYPNQPLGKVLNVHSWGFCGKGSKRGTCVDRPDAWSNLKATNVDWTGALATLNMGGRYTTWTRNVSTYNPKTGHFTYDARLGPGPGAGGKIVGGRYFLSGVLAALDAPGEWFIDESNWTLYVWMPDGSSPKGGRIALKVKDYCFDTSLPRSSLANITMIGCTFRFRKCKGCTVSDVNLTYPTFMKHVHLRDPQPFANGPPPNLTLIEGNSSIVTRLSIRYANGNGLKMVSTYKLLPPRT